MTTSWSPQFLSDRSRQSLEQKTAASNVIDDSFTKEEVEADGYLWRENKIKVDIPEGVEVVESKNLGQFEHF